MSLDLVSEPGPSVIESVLGQSGPLGPRLILGPFRLVNHDCKPNAQVSSPRALCIFSSCPDRPYQDFHFTWYICFCRDGHQKHRHRGR